MWPRIASLLASGTEIVHALGLDEHLVAISHECDWPPHLLDRPRLSRPRFDADGLDSGALDRAVRQALAEHGSVYSVDADALAEARPDLVLTQAVCEVCAVPTADARQALERGGLGATVVSLDAHTLEDILESIRDVGRAAGAEDRAAALVASLDERLRRVEVGVAGRPRPRTLALEWLDPPFAPGHWVPQMIERAGGLSLLGQVGAPSRQVDWSDIAGLDPDALLIMPCGYDLAAARRDADRHRHRLREVAGDAIDRGRAWVVDGSAYFNRSGPRVVEGVEILAGLLHPERFPPPAPDRASRWP